MDYSFSNRYIIGKKRSIFITATVAFRNVQKSVEFVNEKIFLEVMTTTPE